MALDNLDEQRVALHFLHRYLNHRGLADTISGSAQPQITRIGLQNLEIPLPPIAEQKRLALILDAADALRQQRRETLRVLDELAQSLFLELFGDPATNPKGWEVVKLGEISNGGQYGSGASATPYQENLPRYIRITDIDENGRLKAEKVGLSTTDWQNYVLEDGDLLFARSGATVGKTYLAKAADGLCVYAGYLIRFQADKTKTDSVYLYNFTRTESYARWIAAKQNVVAQPNINAKQYADLEIPLPPLALQQQFAAQIEELEAIKRRAHESSTRLDALFACLQARAFAGELSDAD